MIGCDNPSCSYQWVSYIRGLHFQLSVSLVPRSMFVMGLVLPSLSSHRRFRPKFPAPITPRSFQLYCGGIILPPQCKYFHKADDDIAVHRLSSFPSHRLSSCEKNLILIGFTFSHPSHGTEVPYLVRWCKATPSGQMVLSRVQEQGGRCSWSKGEEEDVVSRSSDVYAAFCPLPLLQFITY